MTTLPTRSGRRSRTRLRLALITVSAVVLVGLAGIGSTLGAVTLPVSTIHGVNFQVKTQVDTNYCIQVESGTTERRTLTLQQCGSADNQRWALDIYKSGLNQMIDSQGMCLNGRGHTAGDGVPLAVNLCRGGRAEKLTYTSTGLLEFVQGCIQVPGAAANAIVSLAPCDATKQNQQWLVTH